MWPAILAMGGLSLLKAQQDQKEAKEQRKVEATKSRFSPWSGLGGGQNVKNADSMGTLMQGLMTGAMIGQAMGGAEGAAAGQPVAAPPVSVAPIGQTSGMRQTPMPGQFNPYGRGAYSTPLS